jgi:hypothetical protein
LSGWHRGLHAAVRAIRERLAEDERARAERQAFSIADVAEATGFGLASINRMTRS